ncbi:MAG TPA: T9SS type A sorting domain-containing protein, partial [Candidatus Marinimicrobia bacterium]|nr:T9SS type A sorting domain-containing protein [Candidatus Neomarinimicrobiota bacterium]
DYYPEFFEGTFPHDWDEAVEQYGYDVIINNGTIPWVIEAWTDSLTVLMASGQWETVWQLAAELGHYVADSHQPLHLTLNYNGQLTGNYGIHSRYETHMINPHLSELPLPDSSGIYWSSVIDSVFRYIDEIYPYVSEIIAADDLAAGQDPNYNSTYYNLLWDELDSLTISVIHCAIVDLASIWQTAWINAGNPTLSFINKQSIPNVYILDQNYPNPFNPTTTLRYDLPEDAMVNITIYDMIGGQVKTLINGKQSAGYKSLQWNATNNLGQSVSAGLYLYMIQAGEFRQIRKMVLFK